jgi:hypothetical protein
MTTKRINVAVTLYTRVRTALGSNLGPTSAILTENYAASLQPSSKIRRVCHDHFSSYPRTLGLVYHTEGVVLLADEVLTTEVILLKLINADPSEP